MLTDDQHIARPYAEAWFMCARLASVAKDNGGEQQNKSSADDVPSEKEAQRIMQYSDLLSSLSELLQHPDVTALVENPTVPGDELLVFFESALALLLGKSTSQHHDDSFVLQSKQFLGLLSQYKRWSVLPSIYKLFQIIVAEHENSQRVGVFSSIDLSASQKETLTGELQVYYGGQIELQYHTSEKMAGGVCVRSGDFVIDFSIEDQMQKMAHCMGVKASVNDNEKRTST